MTNLARGGGGESLCVEALFPETFSGPLPDAVSHDLLHKIGFQGVGHMLDPLPQGILGLWLWVAIHALLHERKEL